LAGGSLAMAQVAVLPVLIGLAVDYAIQFQARARELDREAGAGGALAASPRSIRRAAALGAPTIAAAAAASAAAMLVLLLPPVRLLTRTALVGAVRHPQRVLVVGLALAALGWGLDTQTRVETDITKLVPQSLGSLQNLAAAERATGVGGEIDLLVSGKDLAT